MPEVQGVLRQEEEHLISQKVASLIDKWETKYGINLISMSQESRQMMDSALYHSRTIAPVRQALFRVLAEQDPKKAIELEMDAYKRKNIAISDDVAREAERITGRSFKRPEDALAAYRKASAMVKNDAAEKRPESKSTESGPSLAESRMILDRLKKFEQHVEDLDKRYGHGPPILINFAVDNRIVSNANKAAVLVLSGTEMADKQERAIDAAISGSDNKRAQMMTALYRKTYEVAAAAGDKEALLYVKQKQEQLGNNLFRRLSDERGEVVDNYLKTAQATSFFTNYLSEGGAIGGRAIEHQNLDTRTVNNFFSTLTNPEKSFDAANAKEVRKVFDALSKGNPELANVATLSDDSRKQLYTNLVEYAEKNKDSLPGSFSYASNNAAGISEIIAVTQTINDITQQTDKINQAIAGLERKAATKGV